MKDIAPFFAVAVLLFTFGCARKSETTSVVLNPTPAVVNTNPQPTANPNSPIRKIDFRNFTYPWATDLGGKKKTFTLRNGERPFEPNRAMGVSLVETKFAELTGDNEEEAILVMRITTGGSAEPGIVYIYSRENDKPKLLWQFDTGDRAEGGLKDVYVKNSTLIVELFGENEFENGKWNFKIPYGKDKGLCCPTRYTKTGFKWDGKEFTVDGTPEISEIDQRSNRSEN